MHHPILHRGVRDAAVGVLAAIVLGACGPPAAQQGSAEQAAEQTTGSSASVRVADSPLGQILTNAEGFTLYAFDNDEATRPESSCSGDCAVTWPPLVIEGSPTGDGIDAALLGTAPREDGTIQVNANDWPLYTFSGDQAPGETNGQGIGDVWHVVGTDGKPIREEGTVTVQVADSSLGQILVDAEGRTLYAFDNDKDQPQSTCEDACATTWPPLLVGESNVTSDGIDQALVDLSPRKDGTVQVRANSWPLYTFSGDQAPGETNGQGSGGVWHVVGTDGKPIREAAAASSSSYSY